MRFCLHRSEGPLPPSSQRSGKAPWRSHFRSCTGGAAGQAKARQGPATFHAPHSLDGGNCIEGFSSTYRLSGIKLGLFKLICSNAHDTAGGALSSLFHR